MGKGGNAIPAYYEPARPGAAWGLDDDIMACAPEKPTFCASVTTTVKSLMGRAAPRAELVADEEAASVVKVEADRQPPTPWSHILACVMVCVVLLALIGCEMFFDVPEYFQLAWRGVFVFVSLSFAVTQMDL